MPRNYLRSRAALLTSSVLALVVAGLFLQPEIVSAYWHLRFGNATPFHGWSVPVPRGWWAFRHDDQLIIQRMLRFYERGDPAGIIVQVSTPGKPIEPETLKRASIQRISNDGYVFEEDRPIHIGTTDGYCLRFSATGRPPSIRMTCEAPSAQLSIDFYGSLSDVEAFDSVVVRLKPD
jgi:hypothetical protein